MNNVLSQFIQSCMKNINLRILRSVEDFKDGVELISIPSEEILRKNCLAILEFLINNKSLNLIGEFMNKFMSFILIFSFLNISAEVWEDYEPSEEQVQLTVISVQPNYLDNYLVNLKRTWVRGMEIQKELGYIVDYGVWTSESANSPNVWLTITYENMAAMQPNKERYDAVNAEFEKRFGDDDEELDVISKGYEEIRSMVDNQIINRVKFNM